MLELAPLNPRLDQYVAEQSGGKRDELQEVIAFVKSKDFGVTTDFKNFRD